MRAAIQPEAGATPHIGEVEDPTAERGETLIHVRVAGLGGWDISGAYQVTMSYPSVVRGEGVGFTEEGRRVYFGEHARLPYGAFCERTVLPEREVWEIPEDISDELAIAMGIAGTGAFDALGAAEIEQGQCVLITGATGAVGQLGLQLARYLGAGRVVAAGRNVESLERLVERGLADAYAVIGTDDDAASLQAASGGEGYDVVLDMLYGPYFSSLLKASNVGARIMTVGAQGGTQAPFAARDLIYRWHAAWSTGRAEPETRHKTWLQLLELGRQGIDVNYSHYSLESISEAYEAQRLGPHSKVIVRIG